MTEQNTADPAPEAAVPAGEPRVQAPAPDPAPDPAPAPAAPKDRRKLYAALRWTAAAAVFAAVASGVAYGIAGAERTDVPGLSTESDGRWTYPTLSKPALPAGAAPAVPEGSRGAETHYAPLTGLLLPAPEGSAPDAGLKADANQLVSADAFLEEYAPDGRAKLKTELEYEGLRQIAARGWTTPDGTRTRVYLLRFHAAGFVDAFHGCTYDTRLTGAPALETDAEWSAVRSSQPVVTDQHVAGYPVGLGSTDISLYQEPRPAGGDEQTRLGCLQAGDVQAVIVQTRKGGVATVPFHQTVILQSQLLS
ncbi:hypothetical protein AB0M92_05360 [Streptomyces sp. NPDC051582]|uniref:hypothetical protein n=1 Tax=Streptomyces sp. NPDC051582 TaxID=3155167 RepID=UPI00344336D9